MFGNPNPGLTPQLVAGLTSNSEWTGVSLRLLLEQAGVHPTWMNLGAMGVHGNGHMMMLEKNNQQIAEMMTRWLSKTLSGKTAGRPVRVGAAR